MKILMKSRSRYGGLVTLTSDGENFIVTCTGSGKISEHKAEQKAKDAFNDLAIEGRISDDEATEVTKEVSEELAEETEVTMKNPEKKN